MSLLVKEGHQNFSMCSMTSSCNRLWLLKYSPRHYLNSQSATSFNFINLIKEQDRNLSSKPQHHESSPYRQQRLHWEALDRTKVRPQPEDFAEGSRWGKGAVYTSFAGRLTVSYCTICSLPVSDHLFARVILLRVERYVRNVAEDLRDIHDVVKDNKRKLDELNEDQKARAHRDERPETCSAAR